MHRTDRVNILGVGISPVSMGEAVSGLISAVQENRKGYVCVTSVHGIIESQQDTSLRAIHNKSFMTVPDGMPLVWLGRKYGARQMGRVYGPDLMLNVCRQTVFLSGQTGTADKNRFTHFLYGATEETLRKLKANLEKQFPGLQIVGTYAPPFRPLTEGEEQDLRMKVTTCRPDFFWVGLSTPKQEKFMAEHGNGSNPLNCGIMIGVGAAFDIHAGNYKDVPAWVKQTGFHWVFRLCREPKRLWRRYFCIVPKFIWLSFLQLTGLRTWRIER